MDGVGAPDLIVQQGASPHGYSLRHAEAEALQDADIIFWVGEALAPWLERSIDSLAEDAKSVELMKVDGTIELASREGATFEKHSHDHEDEEHGEEREAEEHGQDADEDHGHEAHDEHHHDSHAWLDPENARIWLDVIAADLAALDPEHADTHAANTAKGKAELETLISDIKTELDGLGDKNFIVFHDAYQYFENRFGMTAAGSIKLGDASDPSPARIAEIQDKVAELDIACVFSEPQSDPGLVQTVFEGTDAKVGVLDPLGSELTLGPDLYPQLIRKLADKLSSCL